MLFHMLQKHPNIKRAVINDINSYLIACYRTVRADVEELIPALLDIQANITLCNKRFGSGEIVRGCPP